MTDHETPETPKDTTMAPATETFPRPRLRAVDEPTRLDAQRLFDVPDPTEVTPAPTPYRDRSGAPVYVSAPGTHTRGAPAAVEKLNAVLDERDRREQAAATVTPGGVFRRRARKALTVRQHAERRALQKLRHERLMEHLDVARSVVVFIILVALLLLLVGMGWIALNIAMGTYTWGPTHS